MRLLDGQSTPRSSTCSAEAHAQEAPAKPLYEGMDVVGTLHTQSDQSQLVYDSFSGVRAGDRGLGCNLNKISATSIPLLVGARKIVKPRPGHRLAWNFVQPKAFRHAFPAHERGSTIISR